MKVAIVIALSAISPKPYVLALQGSSSINLFFLLVHECLQSLDIVQRAVLTPQNDTGYVDLNDHTELGDITIPGERPAIEHCDLPGQIESVERAFFVAQAAAVLAKYDASRGMQSPFGFKALFKSQSAIHPVTGKLDNIYQYSSMKGLRPNRKGPTSPRFVCVTQDTAAYYQDLHLRFDLWQRCLRLQPGPRPSQAFYADGTAYIFICPSFFDQAVMPPVSRGSSACPTVVDNRFVINEDANVFYKDYQIYTLLYEMLRFYLGRDGLGPNSHPKEVFDWNLSIRYSTPASILNSPSILFYIASRS